MSTKQRIPDEKIDAVETLPFMIDKLSIDEGVKRNIAKSCQTVREDNVKPMTVSLYDVDGMSFEELQESLCRITENPRQPFSFLANISNAFANDTQISTKPTDIDMQLVAVAKRIEASKTLLEEAKSHIEGICLRAKQNDIRRLWKEDNGE